MAHITDSAAKPVVWILDDISDRRRSAIEQLLGNCVARAFSIGHCRTSHKLAELQHRLLQERPALIWANVQGIPTALDRRATLRLQAVATVATLQLMQGGFVCLEISRNIAAEDYLKAAIPTLPAYTLYDCSLGIQHTQSKRPSAGRTRLATNIAITGEDKCSCGRDKADHVKFKTVTQQRVLSTMQEASVNMLAAVLVTSMTSAVRPVNETPLLVTEQTKKFLELITVPDNLPGPLKIHCSPSDILRFLDESNQKPHRNLSDVQLRHIGLHLPVSKDTTLIATEIALPSESRIAQKAKEKALKEQGIEIIKKKRPVTVEFGDDDMGEDITSIAEYVDMPMCYFDLGIPPDAFDESDWWLPDEEESFLLTLESDLHPIYWLYGSDVADAARHPDALRYGNMASFLHYWHHDRDDQEFVDVTEICGGVGRVSIMLVRRWHKTRVGKNHDIVVGVDLMNQQERDAMWTYFNRTQPLITLLATPCTGLAGFSALNEFRGCPKHFESKKLSVSLGTLGGEVVLWQQNNHRFYFSENPAGSQLFKLPPYRLAERHPSNIRKVVHMCMAGMADADDPSLKIYTNQQRSGPTRRPSPHHSTLSGVTGVMRISASRVPIAMVSLAAINAGFGHGNSLPPWLQHAQSLYASIERIWRSLRHRLRLVNQSSHSDADRID
jgi:hypothetical protein